MLRKPPPGLIVPFILLWGFLWWVFGDLASAVISDVAVRGLASWLGMGAAEVTATISAIAFPIIVSAFLIYWAFLVGCKEREANPSQLRIKFYEAVSGHKSETQFTGGTKAIFYRLLVRPPKGQVRSGCKGTLVDIMVPKDGTTLFSLWSAQRLPLTWATHTSPPVTSMDLQDDHGQFLDVFFTTELGIFSVATPNFVQPNNLVSEKLWETPGLYVFCVSVTEPHSAAQEVRLALDWTGDYRTSHVTRLEAVKPKRHLFGRWERRKT
jgi:hypothetical protein